MRSRATLVLSNHRPEAVAPAQALMARHDAVILEEPPDPGFQPMLSGRLGIDAYLETLDLEYPEFGRRMSEILRELHRAGKRLYQVEPFLERLIEIHEHFADGGRPADLKPGTDLHQVYAAEREATAALIDFYEVSVQGTFEETVTAVKRFARSDADRFALRERMRAGAIVAALADGGSFYIEAGQMHYPLFRELRHGLPPGHELSVTFLMADAVRGMGFRRHLYGPGDLLTLLYRFHPDRVLPEEDLLAGRALIYSKLIAKEEITATADPYPHTRDELETDAVVRRLDMADCRRLYPVIRRAATATAREMVRHYLNPAAKRNLADPSRRDR
ncbi:hypothetical protein [Desulfococcus sp.]|uniref:hypothetical protein n=1 Tax=Desulfococcus sp. TaxID=2025834 RepID=UPI0035938C57